MAKSFDQAMADIKFAEDAIDRQDFTKLPRVMQLELLVCQRAIYEERQKLEVSLIANRTGVYAHQTDSFTACEVNFQKLENWAKRAENAEKISKNLLKGLSLILALF